MKVNIETVGCIQDSQEIGSDDTHMVSRVFFSIVTENLRYDDLYVDIKQPVGGSFETDPIEVGPPKGARYRGPWDQEIFRLIIESYYRKCFRMAFHIGTRVHARMANNRMELKEIHEFEAADSAAGW
jgi:hypothetical protein